MVNAKPTSATPDNIETGKIILEKIEARINPNIALMSLDKYFLLTF